MANILAALKRHNIYRVAAAYAVVAWVLGQLVGILMPVFDLPQADIWSLLRERGMLAQTLDQKPFLLVQQRIVDGRSTKIHSRDDRHVVLLTLNLNS